MSKRTSIFLLAVIVVYVIYFDLSVGTFHNSNSLSTNEVIKEASNEGISYETIEIKSGDTLLSVVEQLSTATPTPSSDQIIADFQSLNPNIAPTELVIGKSYKIPVYD